MVYFLHYTKQVSTGRKIILHDSFTFLQKLILDYNITYDHDSTL